MRATIPPAEVEADARLVRRLLRAQHPDLAELRVRRIGTGWDNAVFRLGPDLTVRLPRRALGAQLMDTELHWLPDLARDLPLPVPRPVRRGYPTDFYPWPWSVCAYVPGRPRGAAGFHGRAGMQAAEDLVGFLRALHVAAPASAPRSSMRGVDLLERTGTVVSGVTSVPTALRSRIVREWEAAVNAPTYRGPAVWLHGDLHGLNVLSARGRITGVIDFGDLCAGDPATDLACAWLLLDRPGRRRMRAGLGVGESMWSRGRGWAVFFGVVFLAHSAGSELSAAIGRRALCEVLEDQPEGG